MQVKAATATISLSENSGYIGDTVTVSANIGSGFASGSTITIKFDDNKLSTSPSHVTADILSRFNANITIPVATTGNHTISATDTNNNIGVATFTVYAPLNVSVSPANWTMDVGQSKSFSASASGGSGSYSVYHWYLGGVIQSGHTTSTFNYSPVSTGSFSITVTVTDSLGTTSTQSSPAPVTVNALPTVSVGPAGSLTMDVGQTRVFTASASGGTGAKSYQWYLDDSLVGTNSATYSYLAALGSHAIYVNVTDSASTPVTVNSSSVSITVYPALIAPNVFASPVTVLQGQTSVLTSTAVSSGAPPYLYQWLQKAPGSSSFSPISGATLSSYSFATTTIGIWSFELNITDSASAVKTSNVVSVTVNVVSSVTISPTSWIMDVGQSKQFTATASGGSGTYTSYQWYVGGVAQSGATTSLFNYSPGSVGSYLITVTVTDNLGTTSAPSSAISVNVSAAPSVVVIPVIPVKMDAGQTQMFNATGSGGSGLLHYQWYLNGSPVSGATASTYSFSNSAGTYSVTCRVTDNASTPYTTISNTVSVTVYPALIAPTVSASPTVIYQGETSILTSTTVSSGASPYLYQWLQKAPGSSSFSPISGATLSSYSFATTIANATGSWSFILQVKDTAGAVVNSSAATVIVNIPPLDHFVFSTIGTQTAGESFSITITAKDASNHTLTNYIGSNILNASTGSISPINTGNFSNGIWTGSVTLTTAGPGITLFTTGSGMSGTSSIFTVNSAALDHFTFNTITSQTAGSTFSITVTAMDMYGNNVTDYTGRPSLTYSAGSISPSTMNAFVNGVGSTSIRVTDTGSSVTITATDGAHLGVSNSFSVMNAPTPNPTATSPPTSTPQPTNTPNPTPIPTTSPEKIVTATTDSGAIVYLLITGSINNTQMFNVTISTNQSAATTTLSFFVSGEGGTTGFSNITIPKIAVLYGTTPTIYIDNRPAQDQGFTQDLNNFYVWYTTHFSTHWVKVQFVTSSTSQTIFAPVLSLVIIVPEIILIYTVIAVRRLRRKPDSM